MTKRLTSLALACLCMLASWAATPFVPTTVTNGQFAADTQWYSLAIGASKLRIADNNGAAAITVGGTLTLADEDLWCFVGNDTDGYLIYNKQAGATKALAASTNMGTDNGGSTFATLQPVDLEGLTGYVNRWQFAAATTTSNGSALSVENGWYVNQLGYASNILNVRSGKLAFWSAGYDNGSAITCEWAKGSFIVDLAHGSFTATNPAGTYASQWTSTLSAPALKLTTGANNMVASGTDFTAASGSAGSATYTLTTSSPTDNIITSYSFTAALTSAGGNTKLTIGGTERALTTESANFGAKGLEEPTAQFVISGTNQPVLITQFTVEAQRSITPPEPQTNLFITDGTRKPYRIPALAKAHNGHILAISDYRPCGSDIGYGEVDIVARISTDNGATWGDEITIGDGTGTSGAVDCGFGDAAVVADSESDNVLLISVCGNTVYGAGTTTRQNPNRVARFRSTNNGHTWSAYEEITEDIYTLFDESKLGPVQSLFFGSGRICQSRQVKVGTYYRLYAALCARPGGNRVIYSDDFGQTWHALGSIDVSPAPGGDEPKCEELPDGRVILSSRCHGGRQFNIFTYTDVATAAGSWGTVATSNASNSGTIAENNATNGEILILPVTRLADNKDMYLALQSVPFGGGRANVGVYFKELASADDYDTPAKLAANWDGRRQLSYIGSAYSTMIMQADNKIAFLYEEETFGRAYTNVYKAFTLEEITKDAYTYRPEVDRAAYVAERLEETIASYANTPTGEALGMLDATKVQDVEATLHQSVIPVFTANPTAQGYAEAMAAVQTFLDENTIAVSTEKVYTLQNKMYHTYLTADIDKYTGSQTVTDNAKFAFEPAADGNWVLRNVGKNNYLGNTQAIYTIIPQKATADEAGVFTLVTQLDGNSALRAVSPTNGSLPCPHLDGQNKLVSWTLDADASRWQIVPVEDLETAISEVQQAQSHITYYDLSGRRTQGKPAKGVYVGSNRRKYLLK